MVKFHSNLLFLHLYMTVMLRAVARALIGGGGGGGGGVNIHIFVLCLINFF